MEEDDDEHRLNIDDSREQNITIFDNDEQSSDDEQVRKNINSNFFPLDILSKEGARSRKNSRAKYNFKH